MKCNKNASPPPRAHALLKTIPPPPHTHTWSPGATTSGLILPSGVGPLELNHATVSISAESEVAASVGTPSYPPSPVVVGWRVGPLDVAPTASVFLAIAGELMEHVVYEGSVEKLPEFPAANMRRCSGFWGRGGRIHGPAEQGGRGGGLLI